MRRENEFMQDDEQCQLSTRGAGDRQRWECRKPEDVQVWTIIDQDPPLPMCTTVPCTVTFPDRDANCINHHPIPETPGAGSGGECSWWCKSAGLMLYRDNGTREPGQNRRFQVVVNIRFPHGVKIKPQDSLPCGRGDTVTLTNPVLALETIPVASFYFIFKSAFFSCNRSPSRRYHCNEPPPSSLHGHQHGGPRPQNRRTGYTDCRPPSRD